MSTIGKQQGDSEGLRAGKVKGWGLEVDEERGFLGASGALKIQVNKGTENFHWARNLRKEPGKRVNKLYN